MRRGGNKYFESSSRLRLRLERNIADSVDLSNVSLKDFLGVEKDAVVSQLKERIVPFKWSAFSSTWCGVRGLEKAQLSELLREAARAAELKSAASAANHVAGSEMMPTGASELKRAAHDAMMRTRNGGSGTVSALPPSLSVSGIGGGIWPRLPAAPATAFAANSAEAGKSLLPPSIPSVSKGSTNESGSVSVADGSTNGDGGAAQSLIGKRIKKCFPGKRGYFFGRVKRFMKIGEIADVPGVAHWRIQFDDGDIQDYTEAETRKILCEEEPAEDAVEVEYEKIHPEHNYYVQGVDNDGPAHQQLYSVMVGGKTLTFVLSVGKSGISSAGRGLFFTLKAMDPQPRKRTRRGGWSLEKEVLLGQYGDGKTKSPSEMFVKDFLFEGRPSAHAWQSETMGDRIIDVTDDATGEVLESAGFLPFMNEARGTEQVQRVVGRCNGNRSVAYYLVLGQTFALDDTIELLVDYGEEYEGVRKTQPSYSGHGQQDKIARYSDVGKEIWRSMESDVLSVLDMLQSSPPTDSDCRLRMKWVAEQIQLRADLTFEPKGSDLCNAREKLKQVLPLFPRRGNKEDAAVAWKNRFLGMWIQWSPTEEGRIEERIEPDGCSECKYWLRGSNTAETVVTESYVIEKRKQGMCYHKRFHN